MPGSKSSTMRIDLIPEISEVPLSERPQAANLSHAGIARDVPIASFRSPAAAAATAAAPARPQSQGSEEGYGELFHNLYDAALVTDLHGRIRDVNARATNQFGYTPAQFSHLTLEDVVAGANSELIHALFENLRRERFSLLQANCVRSDGSQFPAEVTVSLLTRSTPHLCFLIRDETRRRTTDEMLRTEHNALQNASDGIVVINMNTQIEYANPATAAIWGYSAASDLISQPLGILFLTPDDSYAIINSLSGENYQTTGVAIARRSTGENFRVEIHAACNRDSDGNVIGAVISFTDLTERDRVEIAENDALAVREKVRTLSELHKAALLTFTDLNTLMSDIASHAVNNPDKEQSQRIKTAYETLTGLEALITDTDDILDKILATSAESVLPGNKV